MANCEGVLRYPDDLVNRVVCGDCLEIMKLIPDGAIDAVITDPPFFAPATHYQSRISWGRCWGDLSILGQCFYDWCVEWRRIIKRGGHLFCCCNDESYPVFFPVAYGFWDFTAALVWDKTRVGLGKVFRHQYEMILWASDKGAYTNGRGRLHSDILSYPAPLSRNRVHPIDKPVELMEEILDVCTNEGDIVLDSFVGGGSTLEACKNAKRNYIGIEINPYYCKIAEQRLAEAG